MNAPGPCRRLTFLLLQGPLSPFFQEISKALEAEGHRVLRINLCIGDQLFFGSRRSTSFRGHFHAWPAFISRFLTEEGVTDLLLLGEKRPYHEVAIAAAHRSGVRVTVTDFGYLRPDWITLEPDGMTGGSHFPRDPAVIKALAAGIPNSDLTPKFSDSFLHQAVWDVSYHLCNWLFWFVYPHYSSYHIHHPAANYLGTGWRLLNRKRNSKLARNLISALKKRQKPFWVLPLQMEVDYSIRAYSTFPDMSTVIERVIASFARHAPTADHLLIKLHPLDPGLRDWRRIVRDYAVRHNAADRIHFLDGGLLHTLLDRARGVVTVNSTVGIWSLRSNVPTMVLGEAVFDVPGLTFAPGEGLPALDRFWTEAQAPDSQLLDAFIRALAKHVQIRGVYYRKEGRAAAVVAAVKRLTSAEGEMLVARLRHSVPEDRIVPFPSRTERARAGSVKVGAGWTNSRDSIAQSPNE
jgi:capsular polysaccharide export protein